LENPTTSLHALALDNDKAFAGQRVIFYAPGLDANFTTPYISQDKGTIENRIGQIRHLPHKKTCLRKIFHHCVLQVEGFLDNGPVREFIQNT